jgi:hypothetical protein
VLIHLLEQVGFKDEFVQACKKMGCPVFSKKDGLGNGMCNVAGSQCVKEKPKNNYKVSFVCVAICELFTLLFAIHSLSILTGGRLVVPEAKLTLLDRTTCHQFQVVLRMPQMGRQLTFGQNQLLGYWRCQHLFTTHKKHKLLWTRQHMVI